MALTRDGSFSEQRNAVKAYLGDRFWDGTNFDLRSYILDNLGREKEFYIISQQFWSAWLSASDAKFNCKTPLQIDNQALIEKCHKERLREDVMFEQDFVIVPKYVYLPLSFWHSCNKEIKLEAHTSQIYVTPSSPGKLDRSNSSAEPEDPGKVLNATVNNPNYESVDDIPPSAAGPGDFDKTDSEQKSFSKGSGTFKKIDGSTLHELDVYPRLVYF